MEQNPWQADNCSASQEITFYTTWRFIIVFTTTQHWILSCARQIQSTPSSPSEYWTYMLTSTSVGSVSTDNSCHQMKDNVQHNGSAMNMDYYIQLNMKHLYLPSKDAVWQLIWYGHHLALLKTQGMFQAKSAHTFVIHPIPISILIYPATKFHTMQL
jgi:hypothetical protein